MSDTRFTSSLDPVHKRELESLLFFNAGQNRVRNGIVESIDRFGLPQIVAEGDRVKVALAGPIEVQNLFAIDEVRNRPRLVGVALFLRADEETIVVTHIGVMPGGSGRARNSDVFFSMLAEIQAASRRIKGVRYIELIYGPSRSRRLRVRK